MISGRPRFWGSGRTTEIVYVEQVEAPQVIRYVAPLGEPRPLHATSIGKVHLAFMAARGVRRRPGRRELREAAPTAP